MKGECTSCYKEAHETDLRECGQCHWPMCRRCWDYHNGTCERCEWIIPGLPTALTPFVRKAQARRQSRRHGSPAGPAAQRPREPAASGRQPASSTDETTIAQPQRPIRPKRP